jgi:arylsulfatase
VPGEWDNVILLSADALRADHLSCYGYERETSPVLDDLAEESIRFTNAYSASSHTREAVPALLTGEYPDTAVASDYSLVTETVASKLSKQGFATGGFHSNPFLSRAFGFDQGFDTFDDDLHFGKHKIIALAQRVLDKVRNRHYARAEEINERSLSWLDSLENDQPYFLWNHYMDTHGPYEPPGEYATLFNNGGLRGRDAQSLYRRAIKNPDSITEEERKLLIDSYDAEIRYNDDKLGEFLGQLRDRDLLENSLLIFIADHGDAFGEHGYYGHPRYLHVELTRVPLFFRPPGGVDAIHSTPASALDVAATIAPTRDAVGASLFDLPTDRTVFTQVRGEDENVSLRRYAAHDRNSICFCERDLADDSITFDNCSDRSMRLRLRKHVQRRTQLELNGDLDEHKDVNEEVSSRLDALGYKE